MAPKPSCEEPPSLKTLEEHLEPLKPLMTARKAFEMGFPPKPFKTVAEQQLDVMLLESKEAIAQLEVASSPEWPTSAKELTELKDKPINITDRWPPTPIVVTEGKKYDQGKVPMGLLPWEALQQVAGILAFGATKYGKHNWRAGMNWTRNSDAALRHIYAWVSGETMDPESGFNHLAHAACCLLFLLSYSVTGKGLDDRYKGVKS